MPKLNKGTNQEDSDQFLGYFEQQQINTCLVVPIDEDFNIPVYYRNVVNKIEELTEGDVIRFKIDSVGGYLSGLVQLLTAIENTPAEVVAEVIGECHSAASILALSCPNIRVFPYSTMMLHSASFGSMGKAGDVKGEVDFNHEYCKQLLSKVYTGFLTDSELEQLWIGKEFRFSAPEILRRLEQRNKVAEKLRREQARKNPVTPPEYDPKDVAFKRTRKIKPKEDIPDIE